MDTKMTVECCLFQIAIQHPKKPQMSWKLILFRNVLRYMG